MTYLTSMKKFHPLFFFSLLAIVMFWQFFFRGLIPFPGDYMRAWYEPWHTENAKNGALLVSHKPVADDAFRLLYPMKLLSIQEIAQGTLPLWNPYNGAGQPLMAMMHPGFLTPVNILFLLFQPTIAWSLLVALQIPVLGITTYLFCRKINLSIFASYFASFALIFAGFTVVRLLYIEFIFVLASLPFLLFLFESLMENASSKYLFLVPLSVAFLFVSGQPQMILYVLLFLVAYVIFRYFSYKKTKDVFKKILLFSLFLLLGIFLAAIQLVPTAELFTMASINPQSSKFIFHSFLLSPQHLLTIVIPNYFGNQATYNFWGIADYTETAAYVGLIPCFFAVLSIVWKTRKKIIDIRVFLFGVAFITMLSTLNWFGSHLFFSLPIPILATGVPSRIFAITSFAICILSGYGIDAWLQQKFQKNNLFILLCFIMLDASIFLITLFLFLKHASCPVHQITYCRSVALRNTLLESTFFAGSLLFFVAFYLTHIKKRSLFFLCVLTLFLISGYYNFNKFMPFTKKQNFMPVNTLLQRLQATGYQRYFGFEGANIKGDFASYYHLYDPDYFDPLYIKRYGELIAYADKGFLPSQLLRSDVEITNDILIDDAATVRRQRLFALLGINYFVFRNQDLVLHKTSVNNIVWENNLWSITRSSQRVARATLVTNVIVKKTNPDILHTLFSQSFDPTKDVILEENPPKLDVFLPNQADIVSIQNIRENAVRLVTASRKNTLLVLSDTYYPGWKAYIDGKETKIYRANYTFRAIYVPLGNHNVIFSYQPTSAIIGVIITLSTGLLLLISFYCVRRKQLLSRVMN